MLALIWVENYSINKHNSTILLRKAMQTVNHRTIEIIRMAYYQRNCVNNVYRTATYPPQEPS